MQQVAAGQQREQLHATVTTARDDETAIVDRHRFQCADAAKLDIKSADHMINGRQVAGFTHT